MVTPNRPSNESHVALPSAQVWLQNFALGAIAEAISKTAAAPLERSKMLLQNSDELVEQGRISKPFTNLRDVLTRVIKAEGFASLWQGNAANIMRACPAQALNFSFKSVYTPLLAPPKSASKAHLFASNVATGSVAGASSLAFVYSLDVARTRLASDSKNEKTGERQFKNMRAVYKHVLSHDGPRGLYVGFVPGVLGIVCYRGLYFGIYDTLKPLLLKGGLHNNVLASFGIAYIATTAGAVLAYPLDTIKRRMMLTAGEPHKYYTMRAAAAHIVEREGIPALFRGSLVNILRGCAGALTLTLYDGLKDWLLQVEKKTGMQPPPS